MSDAALGRTRIPLGVGALLGASFGILFRHFFRVALLSFVAVGLSFLAMILVLGFLEDFGGEESALAVALHPALAVALAAVWMPGLAYDARAGRPAGFLRYVLSGLRGIVPVLPLGFFAGVVAIMPFAAGIGQVTGIQALVLDAFALWFCTMLSLSAPAAVVERAGFGSQWRSVTLTRGYRLPILGMLLIAGVLIVVASLVGMFVAAISDTWIALGGGISATVVYSALAGPGYGFGGIMVAVIHARLREIKEGLGSDRVVSVFD